MLLAGWRVTLGQGTLIFFPARLYESLPGDLGDGDPGCFCTTSSLEMGVCRQGCPAHIPLS